MFSHCRQFTACCMRNRAFFSLPYLPPSKPALLTFFFRKIWKLFLVAHFGFIFVLCILVDYSLFMPPSKERYKTSCPVVNLCEFSDKNPGANFFAKGPQKKTLSDFLIFDMGTTTCFIANSLLSPLLHVKIHASVGYQRPCYVVALTGASQPPAWANPPPSLSGALPAPISLPAPCERFCKHLLWVW